MRKPKLSALATVGAATAMVANAARTQATFFMSFLLSSLHGEKTILTLRRSWNSRGTFLNGCSDGFVFETWGRGLETRVGGAENGKRKIFLRGAGRWNQRMAGFSRDIT